MANNRVWLKCLNCGEKLYLGKRMGDAQYWWYDYGDGELGRQLNEFYKKHADCVYRENGAIDNYTIEFEVATNANKIRAMTDEELAHVIMCPKDIDGTGIYGCEHSHKDAEMCYKCALQWLKRGADNV